MNRRDGLAIIVQRERTQGGFGVHRMCHDRMGQGPPLLLLHGLAGSRRWWRYNVPALATRFQLHRIDLFGFGASRGTQRFVLAEAAAQLAAWMRSRGLPRASVIGHSMGGLIAAECAALYPDLVDRLVLVNAPVLPLGRRYLRHSCGLFGLLPSLRPDFLPVLVTDTLRAGPRTMTAAISQLLATDISHRLESIIAPTLLIWGARDTLVPLREGYRLHERLPNARLRVLFGAGHNPMWERSHAFNQAVLAFLTTQVTWERG